MRSLPLLCAVLLFTALPFAANGEEDPAFMQRLFAPELILENAKAIELSSSQRQLMMKELKATQLRATEAEFGVYEAALLLNELTEAAEIDEKAMIEAARQVFQAEGLIKEAHLTLLVRMRNALTPAQREKLIEIRKENE